MGKTCSALLLLLIILQTSLLISNGETKRINITIIIRSDGSIYPSYAPIVTADRMTYVLTDDVEVPSGNGIIVERDDVVIDGNGYVLKGSMEEENIGIILRNRRHITIMNITIENFHHGISISGSSRIKINGSKVKGNKYIGIAFYDSSDTEVIENEVENNTNGIYFHHSLRNKIVRNIIKGNGERGLYLYDSSDSEIVGNEVENNGEDGILLSASSNDEIVENIVRGNKYGIGILYSSKHNKILGNRVENSQYGIRLDYSSEQEVTENDVENAEYGVLLENSQHNRIVGNEFTGCGLFVSNSYNNIVEDNVVNEKPLVYLEKDVNRRVSDGGQVILVECEGIIVESLKLSKATVGIQLLRTKNSKIMNNEVEDNIYGLYLYDSPNNYIVENWVVNNEYGLALYCSSENEIIRNEFINCGLYIWLSSYNNIVKNNTVNGKSLVYLEKETGRTVEGIDAGQIILVACKNISIKNLKLCNTTVGIELLSTRDSIIAENRIENNLYGILLLASSNNKIYRNDFIRNEQQVYTHQSSNTWDDDFSGNYWSDYHVIDYNNDGIGDTFYTIDADNRDRYPLIAPYEYFFVNVVTSYGVALGSGWYEPGSVISISISKTIIDQGNGTRRILDGWFEDASLISDKQSFSMVVDRPRTIIAGWKKEYEVKVYSEWGSITGSGWYEPGTVLRITMDKTIVDHGNGTRRVFDGWFEAGSLIGKDQSLSIIVDRPRMMIAKWNKEYEVKVLDETGNARGSGWYRAGTIVTISTSETLEKDFLSHYVFEGWKVDEKLVSISPTYSFILNKPVVLVASWSIQFKLVNLGVIAAILLSSVTIAVLLMKHKPPPPPPPIEKLPPLPPPEPLKIPKEPVSSRVSQVSEEPLGPTLVVTPQVTSRVIQENGVEYYDFVKTMLKGHTMGSETNPRKEGQVEIQEFLGHGSYSVVYRGSVEGNPVAVKVCGIVKEINNEHYLSPPSKKGEIIDFFNQIRTLGLIKRKIVLRRGEFKGEYLEKLIETSIRLSNFDANSPDELLSKYPIREWLADLALYHHNIAKARLYNTDLFEKFQKSKLDENIYPNIREFVESPPFFAMQLADADLSKLPEKYGRSKDFSKILTAAFCQASAATSLVYVCSTIPGEHATVDFIPPKIHKDIKPENILFKEHKRGFRFVITDFGLAETQKEREKRWQTGTPRYMPPEYLLYPYESVLPTFDVYSLGMTILSLIAGYHVPHLLIAATQHELLQRYKDGELGRLREHYQNEAENMVEKARDIIYSHDNPFQLDEETKRNRLIRLQGKVEEWGLHPPNVSSQIDEKVRGLLLEMIDMDYEKRPKSLLEVYFRLRVLLGDSFTKYAPKKEEKTSTG